MCVLCVFSLVELAATSMEQELQRSRSQEDAWNSSAMDLVRASDVSSSLEHYRSRLPAAEHLLHPCWTHFRPDVFRPTATTWW